MPDFSNITLVSVTGLPDAQGAAHSLALCSRQMPEARAVLFSPRAPAQLAPSVRHRLIEPLNYHEYSLFMLFALWKFVDTEFVLIVQDDGWILDMANWRDEFLDYDYLGAPTSIARVDTPQGTETIAHFNWCEHLNRPDRAVWPVLNGGFSLRSRRMLRALVDHPEIRLEIPPPGVDKPEQIGTGWLRNVLNEDVQLSARLRPELEAAGLRFAPLDLCTRFAVEDVGPIHNGMNARQFFGLHGWWRRLSSIEPLTVTYGIDRQRAESSDGERAIIAMLESRGYRLEFAPAQS